MSQPPVTQPTECYAHPGRTAGAVCRRCGRPICPECMLEAPVGWQCRACVKKDSRSAPVQRWRPSSGGRLGNTRVTPLVAALIVVNVIVYVWEMSSKAGVVSISGNRFACPHVVECKYGLVAAAVHGGQWYRLITAAFLHANTEHILFNMLTLAIVGSPIEAELGRARFLALYLVAALGGSVASYLLSQPFALGVGASGAIFGLMGAYLVIARRRRWDTSTILALIGINLLIGFVSSGIDWRAHIGGLLAGLLVGLAMSRSRSGWQLSASGEMAVSIGAAAAVAAVLALLATLPPGHVNL
jgi:membrane associated rhomboid family serine protease